MSAQASYFRLGLFVLVAVGLLVAGVIVLGAGAWLKEGIMAETYVSESVSGLDVGSPVRLNGVQVGQVTRIAFVPSKYPPKTDEERVRFNRYILIEMEIDPNLLPIPKTSMAERRALLEKNVVAGMRVHLQSSLTGPTYINADFVDPAIYKPPAISWTPEYLYVPSSPGTMAQISSAVERLAAQIEKAEIAKVVDNINTLVVDTNKAIKELQVGKINEQVLALATELNQTVKQVEKILNHPSIDKGITDVGLAAAGIKDIVASSQESVTATLKDLPKIASRLVSTAEEIDRIVKSPEVKRTLAGLADTADNAGPAVVALRKTALRLENLLASQQSDVEAVITGLRKTIQNITALSEDASANPSRVLFGAPPPRTSPGEKK